MAEAEAEAADTPSKEKDPQSKKQKMGVPESPFEEWPEGKNDVCKIEIEDPT